MPHANHTQPYLLLNNGDGTYRVPLSNIIYCSSTNSSVTFKTSAGKKIVVAQTLSYYENLLQPYGFIRIHHQTLLNTAYLCHLKKGDETSQITLTTSETLSVSRNKKAELLQALRQKSIETTLPLNGNKPPLSGNKPQVSQKPKTKKTIKTH